jgi:hypothetical protein
MEGKNVFTIMDQEFRIPEAPSPPIFPWEEKKTRKRVFKRRVKRRIKK